MQITDCLAGIWRIECMCKDPLLNFRTFLNINSSLGLQSFPESGEGLISMAFENDEMQLSIGTEDKDYLNSRAHVKKWMPYRFSKEIFESSIELLSNGIEIDLPCLEKKDFVQIQFVIAWSLKKQHHESSCWFAIEQSPEYILKEAGVI